MERSSLSDRRAQLVSLSLSSRDTLLSIYRMTLGREAPQGVNVDRLIDEILAKEYPDERSQDSDREP